MKKRIRISKLDIAFYLLASFLLLTTSCKNDPSKKELAYNTALPILSNKKQTPTKPLSKEFNEYWYAGEAELSSYKLEQARYGELRKGHAVLIYVTEDFLPKIQVKADSQNINNIPVLKLNATKKFNTGVYPYSIMQSTFYPISNNKHAIKVSSSMQEWCGHVYVQLNNKDNFKITSHSYFEGEADKTYKIKKGVLENELWTKLRVDPKSLPTGNLEIIPSFEYARLRHIDLKPYKASAQLTKDSYLINYPDLNRTLTIKYNPNFPHDILGWEETFKSGFGSSSKILTTKASKLKTIKSPYWQKNNNKDQVLRETLLLN